jgi:hypothetical protein
VGPGSADQAIANARARPFALPLSRSSKPRRAALVAASPAFESCLSHPPNRTARLRLLPAACPYNTTPAPPTPAPSPPPLPIRHPPPTIHCLVPSCSRRLRPPPRATVTCILDRRPSPPANRRSCCAAFEKTPYHANFGPSSRELPSPPSRRRKATSGRCCDPVGPCYRKLSMPLLAQR